MEPTDQLDAPNRRFPESRVRRFAKRNSTSPHPSIVLTKQSISTTSDLSDLAPVGSGSQPRRPGPGRTALPRDRKTNPIGQITAAGRLRARSAPGYWQMFVSSRDPPAGGCGSGTPAPNRLFRADRPPTAPTPGAARDTAAPAMATGMLCAVNTRRAADLGDGGSLSCRTTTLRIGGGSHRLNTERSS